MSIETLQIEKKKVLLPKLRFQEFVGHSKENLYKKLFFKDIFLFSTGKNIKQSEASVEFEIPCVRYGELYHMYNEVIYTVINKTNLDRSELLFSKGDEILLPSAGEDPLDIGSASALTVQDVAIGRTINILRPINENVYSQIYVSYYINEKLRKKISKLAKGSSISNVYNSDLKTLEITLPILPEQKKIASFLSVVDEKIQQLSRKKELLEQYKKGVMQQLFSGKLRFKDENGEDYPDWEKQKLGNIAISHYQGINTAADNTNYYSKGFPILQAKHITSEKITYSDAKYVCIEDFKKYQEKYNPKINEILISNIGTLGKIVLIEDNVQFLIAWNIFKVKIEESISNPRFISYVLKYTASRGYFEEVQSGNATKFVNKTEMLAIPILLPCMVEQQKIANFLSSIDDKIESTNQQITQTQTFKKGLLQQMFV